ncbi:hypothetical protein Tco_0273041 [Tanacetum coccineum]
MADMARWLRCGIGKILFTYLGLPIGENMRRVNAWGQVVEKFKNRLADWKAKTMSFGGRLTLVKSVLGSLPLYYFSMFRIGAEIEGMGIEFYSSFRGILSDGRDIRRGACWIRGYGSMMSGDGNENGDKWRWELDEDGEFTIKELTRLVEDKILHVENGGHETI